MTDNEQEMETEQVAVSQEQEANEQTWTDSTEATLPEDDFHDTESDEESVGEGIETTADADEPAAPSKKSGTGVMMGTLAVMALFIGGLAYLQFGGSGGHVKSAGPLPAEVLNGPAQGKQAQGAPENGGVLGGDVGLPQATTSAATSESDIMAVYNAGLPSTGSSSSAQAVALPGESNPDHSVEKAVTAQAQTTQAQGGNKSGSDKPDKSMSPTLAQMLEPALPPSGKEAPASASTPTTPAKTPIVPAQQPPAVAAPASAAASVAAAAVVSADMDARLKEIAAQIEDVRKIALQASQQASQLAAKVDARPSASAASADNGDVERRLAQLEHKMAQASEIKPERQKEPVHAAAREKMALDEGINDVFFTEPATEKPRAKTSSHKTSRAKKKTHVVAKQRVKEAKEKPAKPLWVLRAATPTAAWVSQGDAAELRQVQVGQTLAGIGKVRSIRQEGDQWVVEGTKGVVR